MAHRKLHCRKQNNIRYCSSPELLDSLPLSAIGLCPLLVDFGHLSLLLT